MSKLTVADQPRQLPTSPALNAAASSVGALTNDPRKTIQAIQSGAVAKEAMKELSRSLAFANAIGINFASVLGTLSERTRLEVLAGLVCAASPKDRRTIMEHPLCPAEVEGIALKHDAEKTAEAEARKAERAAEREEKERAKFEELRLKFEGTKAAPKDAVPAE